MAKITDTTALAVLSLVCCFSISLFGEDETSTVLPVSHIQFTSFSEVSHRFDQIQADLDQVRAELASASMGGGEYGGGCDTCGYAVCGCPAYRGGFFAGYEVVLVKPHFEDGVDFEQAVAFVGAPVLDEPRYDYEFSQRFWVGYRNCDGLGIRGRYWNFDQDAVLPGGGINSVGDEIFSLRTEVVDLEFSKLASLCGIYLDFSGGIRYARFETNTIDTAFGFTLMRSDKYGPTFAVEGLVPIGCSNLSLVGNFRGSLLFGRSSFVDDVFGVAIDEDNLATAFESQIGLEYGYNFCSGSRLAVRALMEGQLWANSLGGDTEDQGFGSTDADLGFFGGTLSIIYQR